MALCCADSSHSFNDNFTTAAGYLCNDNTGLVPSASDFGAGSRMYHQGASCGKQNPYMYFFVGNQKNSACGDADGSIYSVSATEIKYFNGESWTNSFPAGC